MSKTKIFFNVHKIISGGQTGADRAGLDVARDIGLDYGGYLPKGRKTEGGMLSQKYTGMTEMLTESYPARTEKNLLESDGTLIFTMGKLDRGTALTIQLAQEHNKPFIRIDLSKYMDEKAKQIIASWLKRVQPAVLNIAGSPESSSKEIYDRVYDILMGSLSS